jgi:hypothetical protein
MANPIAKAGTPSFKFELYEDRVRIAPRFRGRSGTDIFLHSLTGVEFETGGVLSRRGHIRFLHSGGAGDRYDFERAFAGELAKFKVAVEDRVNQQRSEASGRPNTGASGGERDRLADLERLSNLWERGAITDAEFAQAKQTILAQA